MSKISNRPDPNAAFPNPKIPSLCYIKNVVKNPRIVVGDYTYYDDVDGADQFEKHVTHFYDFIGDKLIIGKFINGFQQAAEQVVIIDSNYEQTIKALLI